MPVQFSRELNAPILRDSVTEICLALFLRVVGQVSAPHGVGPVVAETETAETEVVEIAGRGIQERLSVTGSSNLLDQVVLSLESSGPADSMLLVPSSQEEVDVAEKGEDIACGSKSGRFLAHDGHDASIPSRSA